jgi:predicted ABC-type ATPase
MRVFAGPNGSGKSTVIESIRRYKANGKPIDFGCYINADDIARTLRSKKGFSFHRFDITVTEKEFQNIVSESGLLRGDFSAADLASAYFLENNAFHCPKEENVERLAQMIADYLRKKLLKERKRFSFETVFSHSSKLDIMRSAVEAGYKVYLYFVSTESAEINKFRVEARRAKGGHDVPPDKIEQRYERALGLMHDAAQLAYQAYFFDNSDEGGQFKLFAHFKLISGKKVWDTINQDEVPEWFKIHYLDKVPK